MWRLRRLQECSKKWDRRSRMLSISHLAEKPIVLDAGNLVSPAGFLTSLIFLNVFKQDFLGQQASPEKPCWSIIPLKVPGEFKLIYKQLRFESHSHRCAMSTDPSVLVQDGCLWKLRKLFLVHWAVYSLFSRLDNSVSLCCGSETWCVGLKVSEFEYKHCFNSCWLNEM